MINRNLRFQKIQSYKPHYLLPVNRFVLLVITLHFCYLSGNVDHSVCPATTIVRTSGRGRDNALRLHVDSDLYVSVLAFDCQWGNALIGCSILRVLCTFI